MDLWASGGSSEDASARLDELSVRYEHLFQDAEAVSHDALEEAVADARQAGAASVDTSQAREPAAEPAGTPATGSGPDRRVGDLGGRELLAEAGRRLKTRVTGRRRRHG
jgi:hypothetical protein